jgi:hypothetical protein
MAVAGLSTLALPPVAAYPIVLVLGGALQATGLPQSKATTRPRLGLRWIVAAGA